MAENRVNEFKNIIIPKLMETEKRMNALKDPGFQFMVVEANKKAACVEKKASFELLSELLIQRAEDLNNYSKNAGLNVAVNIVDQIDDATLIGLTMAYIINTYSPNTCEITQGLKILDELYASILKDDPLPNGDIWLENLDLLKCIRIISFASKPKLSQVMRRSCEGYFCSGIKKDSTEFKSASEIIDKYNLPKDCLIDHELIEGYLRVPVINEQNIEKIAITRDSLDVNGLPTKELIPLTEEQIVGFKQLYVLCNKNNDEKIIEQLAKKEISKYKYLNRTMEWWDSIKTGFSITSAGRVLSYANASRLYPNLPEFMG